MTTPTTQKQIIFAGTYEQLFDLLACRQRAELVEDMNWLGLLDAVTHPETVEGYEPETVGDCAALVYGTHPLTPTETQRDWGEPSDDYKDGQPYHNEIY